MSAKPIAKAELTRRERFCQQYVLTQNATQSYLDAYTTPKRQLKASSAATEGWKLLRNPDVQARVKELRVLGHETLMVTFEETLQEVGSLAMFDPANMFDQDGRLLQLHEMDPVTRKSVNEIEIVLGEEGKSLALAKVKYGKDKKGYLDMVMKFYNAYQEHQKAGSGEIVVQQYCAQDATL